jgi:tetratricopeptide (TPR) repeat protein
LYIPGAPSEENAQRGRRAVEEFKGVLEIDAQNISAIDGIGAILFQMGGTPFSRELYEESKTFHQKHSDLRPEDPEPYYWIGVIDWTISYRGNLELRAKYNKSRVSDPISDVTPLPSSLRAHYTRDFGPAIDEGIECLKRAMALKPDYDDAMAYLDLLYRRKADTMADESERRQLQKMADDLIDKVMTIKQKKAETQP